MNFTGFAKKCRTAVAAVLAALFVCLSCFALVACTPNKDIKYDKAIVIAKLQFGVQKVLWISDDILDSREPQVYRLRCHYAFYIVGEKDGKEIYVVVPSSPTVEKPFVTTWCLDYTFKQVVEEFNKLGANYVADVPDDYYSAIGSYIKIVGVEDGIDRIANAYKIDEPETFYDRLDAKWVFSYRRTDDNIMHDYIVAQTNGELVSYAQATVLRK